jgi:hypothetical protein
MTTGARKFSAMPGSNAEKALRWQVTLPTITRWGNATRKPDEATRQAIEAAGGPLVCEWDESVAVAAKPPPRAPRSVMPDDAVSPTSAQDEARRLLRQVVDIEAAAEQEDDLVRRAAILASAATIHQRLAKVVGAGHAITERQILESPMWKRLSDDITATLEPWPDAMAALAARLLGDDRA